MRRIKEEVPIQRMGTREPEKVMGKIVAQDDFGASGAHAPHGHQETVSTIIALSNPVNDRPLTFTPVFIAIHRPSSGFKGLHFARQQGFYITGLGK
jgi:hypothetical protein